MTDNPSKATAAYLGAALCDGDVLIRYPVDNRDIDPEYQPLHREMLAIYFEHGAVDLVLVHQRCRKEPWYNAADISRLCDECVTLGLAKSYAEAVKAQGVERRVKDILQIASEKLQQESAVETAQWVNAKVIEALSQDESKIEHLSTISESWWKDLVEGKERMPRLKTGHMILDEDFRITLGGLHIIAGRPGMGKTTYALWMMSEMLKQKNEILFFSAEMSKYNILDKLYKLWDSVYTDTETLVKESANKGLFIDDTPSIHIDTLFSKAYMMAKSKKIDCIVIDYLQLITSSVKENREREVSYITSRLKQLARTLNIPVICLCQLNRAVDATAGKRPMLSNLRESGAVEQDSDSVSFIFRPAYYYEQERKPIPANLEDICEIVIAKQRMWKTTALTCHVDLDKGEFKDWGEAAPVPAAPKRQTAWRPGMGAYERKYENEES